MKNTSINNNNPSHSLYIKLALFLGAIAFSLLHPLFVSLVMELLTIVLGCF